jgi:hypothetical protein
LLNAMLSHCKEVFSVSDDTRRRKEGNLK